MKNLVFECPQVKNNYCDVNVEIYDKDGDFQCCLNKKFLIEKKMFSISINNFPDFIEIEDNNENGTKIATLISKNVCFKKD